MDVNNLYAKVMTLILFVCLRYMTTMWCQPKVRDLLAQCVTLSCVKEHRTPMERFPFSWLTTKDTGKNHHLKRKRTDAGAPFCLHLQTTRSVTMVDMCLYHDIGRCHMQGMRCGCGT